QKRSHSHLSQATHGATRSRAPIQKRSHSHLSQATHDAMRSGAPIQKWAHLDSNQDLTGYEPGALPLSYGPARRTCSSFQEAPQFLRARRMAQLAQRLGLDLANALARDGEILADFFERVLAAVGEAEAQPKHLLLARRERVQHLVGLLAQRQADDRIDGGHDLLVLDEVAEMAVFLLADRRLQRDRLLGDLQHFADLVDRNVHLGGDLFRRRLATKLLHQLPRRADQLVDRVDQVHRNADRAGLVGDGARDRLANPPCRVRRELVAAAVLELVDRLHQADVALLDQIQELQAAVGVLLGDRDDQAQIR